MAMTTNIIIGSVMQLMAPFINPTQHIDLEQLACMSDNVYFEAGNELREGKRAVAHTVLNRILLDGKRYGQTPCDVVHADFGKSSNDCQYSWYCDGKSKNVPFIDAKGRVNQDVVDAYTAAVEESLMAILGQTPDVTNGATHYFNPALAHPDWYKSDKMAVVSHIGNHIFMAYKSEMALRNQIAGIVQ